MDQPVHYRGAPLDDLPVLLHSTGLEHDGGVTSSAVVAEHPRHKSCPRWLELPDEDDKPTDHKRYATLGGVDNIDENAECFRLHYLASKWATAGQLLLIDMSPDLLYMRPTGPADEHCMYCAVNIPKLVPHHGSVDPVLIHRATHTTITYSARFESWEKLWRFRIKACQIMGKRHVLVRFLSNGPAHIFNVDPTCEFFWLCTVLKETLMEFAGWCEFAERLHVSWLKGV